MTSSQPSAVRRLAELDLRVRALLLPDPLRAHVAAYAGADLAAAPHVRHGVTVEVR